MRVHLIGFGSVGTLIAFHLRRALSKDHHVHLIYKSRQVARRMDPHNDGGVLRLLGKKGTVLERMTGFTSEVWYRSHSPAEFTKGGQHQPPWTGERQDVHGIDILVVANRSREVESTIRRLSPRLSSSSTIVLLSNPLSTHSILATKLFPDVTTRPHFILGLSTHGVHLRSFMHSFSHPGIGTLKFAIVPEPGRVFEPELEEPLRLSNISTAEDPDTERYASLRNAVAAFTLLDLNSSWIRFTDMQLALRKNLVAKMVVHCLTALTGKEAGSVGLSTAGRRISRRLCNEASDIFRAEHAARVAVEVQHLLDRGQAQTYQDIAVDPFPGGLLPESLLTDCEVMARKNEHNRTQMLGDVKAMRDTDINFLNGYMLSLAKKYEVPAPSIATLLNLILMTTDHNLKPAG
ncbi:hypothetical protein FISHEDRAFT_37396 [Fistulina hepatica ATCC 64428]|uniref:6-phosphogluconate dehydrogenase C-terminal domain-like protein n=1 Tax=Fistulina hepatica ATCC 64428 TaxID=1128425 RepID=A0A0D7AKJ6_9AGAR|nr:hypothetical protein FISHEDRAFT_37396 [Fistulina hepatica ATCC 64428]